MSKTLRLLIYSVIVLSIVFAAAGCAQAPAEEEQNLSIWINGRDSFIGPNEQQLPQDQWYISQAIKRFEDANPGVSIELIVQSDAYAAHQMFRTAGLAGNAPDIGNFWAGEFVFPLAEVITPINDMIPDGLKNTNTS